MKSPAICWRIRSKMERRFRLGHPWVYSNELIQSPRGLEPGATVELQDASGKFLARGFGNPHSLIAFRAVSRDPAVLHPMSLDYLKQQFYQATRLRWQLGYQNQSCRLCYAEADHLPGLVVDRYVLRSGQVFVIQAHSAGAQQWLSYLPEVLESWTDLFGGFAWHQTGIVVRNDLKVRTYEGLSVEAPQVLRSIPEMDLENIDIIISAVDDEPRWFTSNLVSGQKTGFFLDQRFNLKQVCQLIRPSQGSSVQILDLFSYVGQWGVQLGSFFQKHGCKVQVVAVDASQEALKKCDANLKRYQISSECFKADVLADTSFLPQTQFDWVIVDPPALIKQGKHQAVGTHAYLKLATQAFRWVKPGGGIVFCSCSSFLKSEDYLSLLSKAALRNHLQVQWVGRGGLSPDHPILPHFPEGRYLKAWMGLLPH